MYDFQFLLRKSQLIIYFIVFFPKNIKAISDKYET